jgi:protein-arginine kinase activator protein McsA
MGQFDSIKFKSLPCIQCGRTIENEDWQTKAGPNCNIFFKNRSEFEDLLITMDIVIEAYKIINFCPFCGAVLEYVIKRERFGCMDLYKPFLCFENKFCR